MFRICFWIILLYISSAASQNFLFFLSSVVFCFQSFSAWTDPSHSQTWLFLTLCYLHSEQLTGSTVVIKQKVRAFRRSGREDGDLILQISVLEVFRHFEESLKQETRCVTLSRELLSAWSINEYKTVCVTWWYLWQQVHEGLLSSTVRDQREIN